MNNRFSAQPGRTAATGAMAAVAALTCVATASPAQSYEPWVTQGEYNRLYTGMSPAEVKALFDTGGRIESDATERSYKGWNDRDAVRIFVRFTVDRHGKLKTSSWYHIGPES